MRLTLVESNRRYLQTAECATLSMLVHVAIVWVAIGMTAGGRVLPADEREARVFFLLPPDRIDTRSRQPEILQWARPGGDVDDGRNATHPGEGWLIREPAYGRRNTSPRSGARGQLPPGPEIPRADTAFSVIEVDSAVERFEWSAAPVYPSELLASGTEGMVYAQFVVDTTGSVDMTSIRLLSSAHPAFSASVLEALADMRFRPAKRGHVKVRQLVEQHFRFTISRPQPRQVAEKQVS
jgi:TonB family protein